LGSGEYLKDRVVYITILQKIRGYI
jgi:hypothetical protein